MLDKELRLDVLQSVISLRGNSSTTGQIVKETITLYKEVILYENPAWKLVHVKDL